eukprot:TRINITY_DN995_c0_g1_i2.p1 TRINITY_DN995_c0_g1~~TRINITY_DN995_c0_g1_i2.p1  ORF type:complete len:544 (-),score=117.21 TRINITY_DN995_c0_g1_i2:157-1788(-)
MQKRRVFVVGVGMTKFEKPGRKSWDYPDMAKEAGTRALVDAGIPYTEIEQATVGYVYGDSTCGQRAIYTLGLTGIPIYNVNNNCSTGSTALIMAKKLIEGGSDCVLALGFEKMERGSLKNKYSDRANPLEHHMTTMMNLREITTAPFAPQMFGNAGREHMERYGTTKEQIAKIAQKNHKHSGNNPYSQFQDEYTLDQILASPPVYEPLTKLQCCPTSDGAAAAVVCSEAFVRKYGLEGQAVEIAAMNMATDTPASFKDSCIKMVGSDMSRAAAERCYADAKIGPQDVQVIELHDCFAANELVTYEALGLCPEGKAGELVDRGDVTYGGRWVVNPSGGLISKGHPLGATGLAQCAELCWQLRRMAGARQVKDVKYALQHNIGLGGAAIVGIYRLGFPSQLRAPPHNDEDNPAVKVIDIEKLRAAPMRSSAAFDRISRALAEKPSMIKGINGVYQFNIKGPDRTETWVVDCKIKGTVSRNPETDFNADCVITAEDADFADIMDGKASTQVLYMKSRLQIEGSRALASKLEQLQTSQNINPPRSKL